VDKILSDKMKILSFISMIMILYLHSYNIDNVLNFIDKGSMFYSINIFIQNFISQGITRIAVPMFFLISGFLFFNNFALSDYRKIIFKKVKTLLIPYIFWSSLVVFIYFIIQLLPQFHHFFVNELIRTYSFSELIMTTYVDPKNYPLWFMRDLMIMILISPLILYLLKKKKKIFLSITFLTWLIIDEKNSDTLLFFSLGAYFALFNKNILSIQSNKTLIFIICISYTLLLFLKTTLISFSNNHNELILLMLHKFNILLGIILIWYTSNNIVIFFKMKKLWYLTEYTFLFYVFHEPLLSILTKGGISFLGNGSMISLILYLLIPIIIIPFLVLIGRGLKNYMPELANIITGNRF